ncbi:MAG: hypothetical protein FWD79_05860 [Desulfobulbus sp.]|nr:hypothetical protein [Desulfobulbus sp.]
MNRCGNRRSALLILALLTLLSLGGCGFKNAPVPPRHVIPVAIQDLRAELDDKGATLSWTYPKKTLTGKSVEEIGSFLLYRAEVPADSYCPTCPVPYDSWMTVSGGILASGEDRTATCEVRGLRPGQIYFFKVRSKAGLWIESQDSNEVTFFWQTPPATPDRISAVGGDGKNVIQWQPVDAGATSPQPLALRYQLYRGVGVGPVTQIGEPVEAASYTDTAVENGKVYVYRVQAISTFTQGSVKSGLSGTAEARPLKRTAPSVPDRIDGLRTEVGVKIFWDHVKDEDLVGYRVYRRAAGEDKAIRVGEVELPYNMFIDTKAPNVPLFYSISSIDGSDPPNESARSAEIRIDR